MPVATGMQRHVEVSPFTHLLVKQSIPRVLRGRNWALQRSSYQRGLVQGNRLVQAEGEHNKFYVSGAVVLFDVLSAGS